MRMYTYNRPTFIFDNSYSEASLGTYNTAYLSNFYLSHQYNSTMGSIYNNTLADGAFAGCKISGSDFNYLHSSVRDYCFCGTQFSSINTDAFSNVTGINAAGFMEASFPRTTTIAFDNCLSIGSSAFAGTMGSIISFPIVKRISTCAFRECTATPNIDFASVVRIESSAFQFCRTISSMTAPLLTTIQDNTFWEGSMRYVDCPSVTQIRSGAFYRNKEAFSFFSTPALTSISASAFYNCSFRNSNVINWSNLRYIESEAFYNAYFNNVNVFIGNSETDITIGSRAFYNTQITGSTSINFDGYCIFKSSVFARAQISYLNFNNGMSSAGPGIFSLASIYDCQLLNESIIHSYIFQNV